MFPALKFFLPFNVIPIYKYYMFLLLYCGLKDFARDFILEFPVGTKVDVHAFTWNKDFAICHFIGTNDGFLFDLENSYEASKLLVWDDAYLEKLWV
ncbi:hypothetical protein TNIN_297391 [Trichonephila inaurata madagascariensis]|uniref:Uncharacterized protein n=1 Tax=Trichonephila inaurata madagascariensis TaxID=2747483 RepID=A0A8X6X4E3_9ARAC|nr:hypothetical protein TNIN_297391 [Trichonephila inaurata madagascariensis]